MRRATSKTTHQMCNGEGGSWRPAVRASVRSSNNGIKQSHWIRSNDDTAAASHRALPCAIIMRLARKAASQTSDARKVTRPTASSCSSGTPAARNFTGVTTNDKMTRLVSAPVAIIASHTALLREVTTFLLTLFRLVLRLVSGQTALKTARKLRSKRVLLPSK